MECSKRQIKDIKAICDTHVSQKDIELQRHVCFLELKMRVLENTLETLRERNRKMDQLMALFLRDHSEL